MTKFGMVLIFAGMLTADSEWLWIPAVLVLIGGIMVMEGRYE